MTIPSIPKPQFGTRRTPSVTIGKNVRLSRLDLIDEGGKPLEALA